MNPTARTDLNAPLLRNPLVLATLLLLTPLLATLLLATSAAAASAADPDPHDLGIVEAAGPFDVTLEACTFVAERMECRLKVHNRLDSAELLSLGEVLLYDNEGRIYRPETVRVGGETHRPPHDPRRPGLLVPADTKVQVEIELIDVSRRKQKASKLMVRIAGQPPLEIGPFPFARR